MNIHWMFALTLTSICGVNACTKVSNPTESRTYVPVVQTSPLELQTLADESIYPGQVASNRELDLIAEVGGLIEPITIKIGSMIRRDQLLLVIQQDPTSGFKPFRVFASIAGEISDIYVHEGERVQPGQKLLRLVDSSRAKIVIHINQSDLEALHVGDTAEWSSWDEQVRLPVRISALSRTLDPKLGTAVCELVLQGVSARPLVNGSMGFVRFTLNQRRGFMVPAKALVYQHKEPHLIVVNQDLLAQYVPIVVVKNHDEKIEVQGKFIPGSKVIVQASNYVGAGEKVKLSAKD